MGSKCRTRVPKGLLQVVPGDAEAGEALVVDERVPMIAFTGSPTVGRRIGALAGQPHQFVKGIGDGFGTNLPDLLARFGIERLHVPFDLVKLTDVFQRRAGHQAGGILLQVEEFPTSMGHAACLKDAPGKAGLVARVVVADKRAFPRAQEGAGMFARKALGEVIDHPLIGSKAPAA